VTVIATFSLNGFPFMLGDLLISGPRAENEELHLPTIGDTSAVFLQGSARAITGLRQKLCVIGDNLAIGWSGSYIVAQTIVKELMRRNQRNQMTRQEIRNYFANLDDWTRQQDLHFVGYVAEAGGIGAFGYNCSEFRSDLFGTVMISGSGASELESYFDQFTTFPQPAGQDADPIAVAAAHSLIISGYLLQSEIANRDNLKSFYGGGYELLTLMDGKFKKIDDITYVFFVMWANEPEYSLSLPQRVIKYCYDRDLLIMRAVEFTGSSGKDQPAISLKEGVHVVSPIYRYPQKSDLVGLKRPPLSSRLLCIYIFVIQPENRTSETIVICEVNLSNKSEGRPIVFFEENGKVAVAVSKSFAKHMVSRARQELKSVT